jgi:hypothetical protein
LEISRTDAGRTDGCVRLQTVRLMDASLNKITRIGEHYSLQDRMECFNLMNSLFLNTLQFNNDPTNATAVQS